MPFDIPPVPLTTPVRRSRLRRSTAQAIAVLFLVLITVLCGVAYVLTPPSTFPAHTIIDIPEDASAAALAQQLQDTGVIRSAFVFRVLARISLYDHHLDPGMYVFETPISLPRVLYRIGNAHRGIDPISVTLTEGMTSFDMADTLSAALPSFSREAFLQAASTSEGYLFPETYQLMPGDTPDDVVSRLRAEFDTRIATITPAIAASGRTQEDIVTMASILEREARTPEDMRIVAGILWNRIAIDMRLQVDAVFGYIHQENGYTPTAADLQSNSPYNTYRNTGLPPTPIANPGIAALEAAALPAETDYLYYLTGVDGNMYYARTFDEHRQNRARYLDI